MLKFACVDGGRADKVLGEELPALAKEVARVETVRMYAGQLYNLTMKLFYLFIYFISECELFYQWCFYYMVIWRDVRSLDMVVMQETGIMIYANVYLSGKIVS